MRHKKTPQRNFFFETSIARGTTQIAHMLRHFGSIKPWAFTRPHGSAYLPWLSGFNSEGIGFTIVQTPAYTSRRLSLHRPICRLRHRR